MKKSLPFFAIGNRELDGNQSVNIGDRIKCTICKKSHKLEAGISNGKISHMIYFYKCGNDAYMAALQGKLLDGVKLA